MNNTHELSNSIRIEEITPEFLESLTKTNAKIISIMNPHWDDLKCWLEAEKSTGAWIALKYICECKGNDCCLCPKPPDICIDYLDKINIAELKAHIAYYFWSQNGRNRNNPKFSMDKDYFGGCNYIMSFCEHVLNRTCGRHSNSFCVCYYNKYILDKIDRRQTAERRKKERRINMNQILPRAKNKRKITDRRSGTDRRMYDHRGDKASYL